VKKNSVVEIFSKIIEVIIYAGAVQGIFLGTLLLTAKNRKRKPNRILAILLFILSASIIHSLISFKDLHVPYKIREPFIFLIGPLLLFYVREFTSTKYFELKDTLHFFPFFGFFVFLVPIWMHGINSSYSLFLMNNASLITNILWFVAFIQFGYYWIRILRMIHRHRMNLETEFSAIEGKSLSWIKGFLHIFGLFFVILPVTLIIILHTDNYTFIDKTICLALSYIIFVLGYNGLSKEVVFSNVNEEKLPIEKKEEQAEKISTVKDPEEIKRMLLFIAEKKPFLDENLTLTRLAEQLGMTRNQLSSIINNDLASSFYDFINKYRIEEVKKLIADPKNKNFTILSLAFEAGFSSKSTFNNIFKKVTGTTPSKYRENLS
jgi:AraC-like DNA-binding protein